mmetsp:Transcript_19945/g.32865  ORF Transcript_19945/g.32865 Transcript_19945/m.32865 type:complete len:309 (-) Transcript_19945:1975-2901(-)
MDAGVGIALLLGGLVFLYFLLKENSDRKAKRERKNRKSFMKDSFSRRACRSPDCLRCNNYSALFNRQLLEEKMDKFVKAHKASEDIVACTRAVDSMLNETEGLGKSHLEDQRPTVFYLDGLTAKPIWSRLPVQEILEKEFNVILEEFNNISMKGIWYKNDLESELGSWSTYYFINQGVKLEENCATCPQTFSVIKSIKEVMGSIAFGNVFFSRLSPGTTIEPHCGPTNIRLRVHLALITQERGGFELDVARHKLRWQVGKTMVFDDSFVHSVEPKGDDTKERVVLVIDIFHPDVTPMQQRLLTDLFSL